jgi:hypothetical protein
MTMVNKARAFAKQGLINQVELRYVSQLAWESQADIFHILAHAAVVDFQKASDQARKQWQKLSTTEWRHNTAIELRKGSAWAHSRSKPVDFRPLVPVSTSTGPSLLVTDVLQDQVTIWSKWWQESEAAEGESHDIYPLEGIGRTPLTAKEIRHTASRFPANTSRSDGWQPRQIGCLCDRALEGLAILYHIAELVGDYPIHLRGALVTLIDKTDGGLRPITLFRAVYRLHAKARAPSVRQWARTLRHPAINMAEHRQVLDGTYRLVVRQLLKQEANPKTSLADLLWDLRKAFENISRGKLWGFGNQYKYPVDLLRISISSYRWPRHLLMGNLISRPIGPGRGIGAGSAFATYELTLYLWSTILLHTTLHPTVTLSIHVDDFSQSASGVSDDETGSRLVASAKFIHA